MMAEEDIFGNMTGTDYHTEHMDQYIIAGAVLLSNEFEEDTHHVSDYQTPDRSSNDSDVVALILAIALLAFFGWLIGYALVQSF